MATPLYQSLDPSQRQIRLLEVVDASGDTVACHLSTVDFDKTPSFTALSYLWGDPTITETITVNGHPLPITTNLASALRHVKAHWSTRFPSREPDTFRLWADAVCINQADTTERGHQVRFMADIYASAELVIAWLGAGNPEVERGMEVLEILATEMAKFMEERPELNTLETDISPSFLSTDWLSRHPSLCGGDSEINKHWEGVGALSRLSYWSRVWVMQELALARGVVLVYGLRSVSFQWNSPASRAIRAMNIIGELGAHPEIPSRLGRHTWLLLSRNFLVHWTSMSNIATIQGVVLARENETEPTAIKAWSWSSFCSLARRLDASDPRDYVYGLLGLTQADITPDYSSETPASQVFVDYAAAWVRFYNANSANMDGYHQRLNNCELWMLGHNGVGVFDDSEQGFPSWVPDFSQRRSSQATLLSMRNCCADQGVFPLGTLGSETSDRSLFVNGVVVDAVQTVAPIPSHNEVHERLAAPPEYPFNLASRYLRLFVESFLARHKVYRPTGLHPLQAIFRALERNGNYDPHSATAASLGFVGLLCGLPRVDGSSSTNEQIADKLVGLGFDASLSGNEAFSAIFALPGQHMLDIGVPRSRSFLGARYRGEELQVLAVLWGFAWANNYSDTEGYARLFETDGGYVGLGPQLVQPGDTVAILKGLDAAALLRKQGDKWLNVDICFVEGLMKGEAREFLASGKAKIQRFEIV